MNERMVMYHILQTQNLIHDDYNNNNNNNNNNQSYICNFTFVTPAND